MTVTLADLALNLLLFGLACGIGGWAIGGRA